jgi:crotonobetainyl-CoA:carnitine CoA-transferase CaiB-like acyl-CoA transferase
MTNDQTMKDLLNGVRILAVEQFGAGPFGTLHLADLGAEVIKVENPKVGGDISRHVPPYTAPGDSLYFQSLNRNKRSLTLDLKQPEGQQVFHDLVRISNAVFFNLRGDQPHKLGLTYEQLQHINPQLVCCSLSGFGLTGPRQSEPGYDYLMQAYAGWMSLTGDPNGPPAKSGLSVVDYAGGAIAMMGLLAGLLNVQRTGLGCDVDVSLLDTAMSMLNYLAIWTLNRDYRPERLPNSAHPTIVPAQAFRTQDSYLVIFCAKEKFWRALTEVMEAPDLAADPRYASMASRYEHREALIADLKQRFVTRPTAAWLARLQGKVPCAPVNSLEEALADDQVLARDMIMQVEHPVFGPLRQVRTAVKVPGAVDHKRPGPPMGADTEAILRQLLAYNDEEIASLRQAEII